MSTSPRSRRGGDSGQVAVAFAGNRPPLPGEDGTWLGDTCDLLKNRTAESLADLGQSVALEIREAYTGWKVGSEDAILGCQALILEQGHSNLENERRDQLLELSLYSRTSFEDFGGSHLSIWENARHQIRYCANRKDGDSHLP
jgi:hypothetical protein